MMSGTAQLGPAPKAEFLLNEILEMIMADGLPARHDALLKYTLRFMTVAPVAEKPSPVANLPEKIASQPQDITAWPQKVAPERQRIKWTPERDADLLQRREAGEAPGAIAHEYGCASSAIHTRLHVLRRQRVADGELPQPRPPEFARSQGPLVARNSTQGTFVDTEKGRDVATSTALTDTQRACISVLHARGVGVLIEDGRVKIDGQRIGEQELIRRANKARAELGLKPLGAK